MVRQCAYKLSLLPEVGIHPVFHVSQLREHFSSRREVQNFPPTFEVEIIKEPGHILDLRNFGAWYSGRSFNIKIVVAGYIVRFSSFKDSAIPKTLSTFIHGSSQR